MGEDGFGWGGHRVERIGVECYWEKRIECGWGGVGMHDCYEGRMRGIGPVQQIRLLSFHKTGPILL